MAGEREREAERQEARGEEKRRGRASEVVD